MKIRSPVAAPHKKPNIAIMTEYSIAIGKATTMGKIKNIQVKTAKPKRKPNISCSVSKYSIQPQ